jgi:uncharacterized protein YecE (DUF72 family)
MRPAPIQIGTSGWHYGHWRGPYYPADLPASRWLQHYSRDFRSAEINGSFYRMPTVKTLTAWRETVPTDFRFAVKASRYLTHARKLLAPMSDYDRFFEGMATLKPKLGPILLQTPPRWRINRDRLEAFLMAAPSSFRYAFEFRDSTWLVPEIFELLADHDAALCIYHLAGFQSPLETTTDFVYVRLHGPGAKYQGRYSSTALRNWAARLTRWSRQGRTVWCFFDNDQNGFAVRDAQRLQRLVGKDLSGDATARKRQGVAARRRS